MAYFVRLDSNAPPSSMKPHRLSAALSLGLCLLDLGFLLSGLRPPRRQPVKLTSLPALDLGKTALSGSGFALDAVYPSTSKPSLQGDVQFFGSWLNSDASLGSATSSWYNLRPNTSIWIAGYPAHPGIALWVEILSGPARETSRLRLATASDPGEHWILEKIPLPNDDLPAKFRIIAVDHSTAPGGWIGFSTPFVPAGASYRDILLPVLRVVCTAAAAIVLFLAPGLLLRGHILHRPAGRCLAFIWVPVPGILGAALLGLLAWAGPAWASGRLISALGIAIVLAFTAYALGKSSVSACTSPAERKALFVFLLLIAVAVAKSVYSVGPVGELYQGSISRTLQVGDRSDSRVPYHAVQLIGLRERPHHALANFFFSPWNFSSRGPLAALSVSPLVLAAGCKVPRTLPEQPWMVFDPEGFMAYRISMIVLASACLLIVFGLSAWLMPEEWANLAFLATVSAPFVLHEIYFTWPKLEAASFFLLAVYLVLNSRWFLAGLAVGLAYLFHPSVLLFVPSLLLLLLFIPAAEAGSVTFSRKLRLWLYQAASICAGLALWLGLWRFINRRHFDQGGFLNYFFQADRQIATLANWLQVRLDSLLNTLVPLNLFLFHRAHYSVNSVQGPSPAVVSFFFQDWTSLPFGIGILFFLCLFPLGYISFKKAPALTISLFVVPLLFFDLYWGAASTGMLREGMHTWFLGITIGTVLILQRFGSTRQRLFHFFSWTLLFRGVELLLMLLLPAIWSRREVLQPRHAASDVLSLLTMFAAVITLAWLSFRASESLRKSSLTSPT